MHNEYFANTFQELKNNELKMEKTTDHNMMCEVCSARVEWGYKLLGMRYCDKCHKGVKYGLVGSKYPIIFEYDRIITGLLNIEEIFYVVSDSWLVLFHKNKEYCKHYKFRSKTHNCSNSQAFAMIKNSLVPKAEQKCFQCFCTLRQKPCSPCMNVLMIRLMKIYLPFIMVINTFSALPADIMTYLKSILLEL